MKKFLCAICSFSLFFTLTTTAVQSFSIPDIEKLTLEDIRANEGTIVLNEYDLIQQIRALKKKGELTDRQIKNTFKITDDTIQKIENSDSLFQKNLEEKRALSKEDLLNSGYAEEQIKIIKDVEAHPAKAYQAASAQLYANLRKTSFIYSSPQTKLVTRIEWSWTTQPLFLGNDIWEFSCNQGMYLATGRQYSAAKIWYYRNGDTGNLKEEVIKSVVPTGPVGKGCVRFAMNLPDHFTNEPKIALAGIMQMTWTKQAGISEAGVYANMDTLLVP